MLLTKCHTALEFLTTKNFFSFQKSNQIYPTIFSCQVSWSYFVSWQFLKHSLFLMILQFEMCSLIVWGMSPNLILSHVLLMVRLSLWVLTGRPQRSSYYSHSFMCTIRRCYWHEISLIINCSFIKYIKFSIYQVSPQ